MVPLSILDLSHVVQGSDAADALRRTLDLAQHAERWGYRRFWLAEHHNMTGIASAATSVVIGYVAGGTSTIRVGAGGIMLPNHAPLLIAEQFGTLATLYPGRVDLGLGRAPGSDQATMWALRRDPVSAERFPQDVMELQHYFGDAAPDQEVRAVPGVGLRVPLWILGSSVFGAQLAAALGLPFAFASHFAPTLLDQALALYRSGFRPSAQLDRPHAMVAVNVFAADSASEARRLFSSVQQAFVNLRRGRPGPLPPPVGGFAETLAPMDRAMIDQALACSVVGTSDDVRQGLADLVARTGADELIVASGMFDHAARLRSYEIAMDVAAGSALAAGVSS